MTAPWQWVICRTGPRELVVDAGLQHTRLYSAPDEIAAERLTVHAYNQLLAGKPVSPDQLVCRVRRAGDHTWSGTATGDRILLPTTTPTRRPA
ncbi:hypothetical protein AB0L22_09130 [Micromonospora haikouensis]|uniref:hypothetical protein n=1 Tax=Micromonospora haikouensis TaxID=686309 RepID=UPI003431E887